MKTPEDCLFRILRTFDSSGWNALACIAAFIADNKLHAMYTTEQELSGEYSPGIIKPLTYYNRPLLTGLLLSLLLLCTVFTVRYIYILCSLCGWSLETSTALASATNIHSLIDESIL